MEDVGQETMVNPYGYIQIFTLPANCYEGHFKLAHYLEPTDIGSAKSKLLII